MLDFASQQKWAETDKVREDVSTWMINAHSSKAEFKV